MKVDKELMKGSTVVVLLTMLNKRPMYGYEIIKQIEATSAGVFEMKEGTIYPILHTLESEKMLDSHHVLLDTENDVGIRLQIVLDPA